jgi:1,2-phenylacetyl-CoA epoxidase catalytic subunit
LKRWTNEEARAMYIKELTPMIEALGLTLPPIDFDRHIA